MRVREREREREREGESKRVRERMRQRALESVWERLVGRKYLDSRWSFKVKVIGKK